MRILHFDRDELYRVTTETICAGLRGCRGSSDYVCADTEEATAVV
jgi:hypothetical protein